MNEYSFTPTNNKRAKLRLNKDKVDDVFNDSGAL